ncbi:MAG: PD40 domain-containing protein [Bacteroidales bacterium]|nr:PD40 domain-containing protein [Bacteroidales bacterium]
MIRRRGIIVFLLLVILMTACPYYGYKYNTGVLPTSPVNLEDFNTQYDDYNLSAPTINHLFTLFFSTNRNSDGENFDIIHEDFEIEFDKDNADLTAGKIINNWWGLHDPSVLNQILDTINTPYNELGPVVSYLNEEMDSYHYNENDQYLVLWASDQSGDLDIMLTHTDTDDDTTLLFIEPAEILYLNSGSDDAYPSIDFDNKIIYFCSDRGLDFDIYSCELPAQREVLYSLENQTLDADILKCAVLSSPSNDKCPSISNNVLVFTSDRPGGQGGYDLWYSVREGSGWSEPENFGKQINTEYDEYRPILKHLNDFQHDLLMFSSNRPGGKGGFDLYFVGVKKLIESDY